MRYFEKDSILGLEKTLYKYKNIESGRVLGIYSIDDVSDYNKRDYTYKELMEMAFNDLIQTLTKNPEIDAIEYHIHVSSISGWHWREILKFDGKEVYVCDKLLCNVELGSLNIA